MSNNLQTIRNIYEAFGKGDVPFIINCLADDVQWEQWAGNTAQDAGVPWMKGGQGKEAVIGFFETLGQLVIKDFRVLSLMGNVNQVAAEFVIEAEIPATGGHYRDEEIHLWTFDDAGKIIRLRHYLDTAKHIAAAVK
jgi:ketosteroid isomerase-like protein